MRKRICWGSDLYACLIIAYGLMMFSASVNAAFIEVPLSVMLNTEEKGEIFIQLEDGRHVYVAVDDLISMGVKPLNTDIHINEIPYISLSAHAEIFSYELDEKSLVLRINAQPHVLSRQVIDFAKRDSLSSSGFTIDSAFVNYSVTRQFDVTDYQAGSIEAVLSAHDVMLQSHFSYSDIGNRPVLIRGMTRATRDLPGRMLRVEFGDFASSTGELGVSRILGGVSVKRMFSMSPYFYKFPGLGVSGVLQTPSRVDLFVDGMLLRSELMSAGEFEFANLPNVYGAGSARLEVTDAFGRRSDISIPYYVSSRLLKRGVHEYEYSLGYERESLNQEDPHYIVDPLFLVNHRVGVSKALTAGFQFFSSSAVNSGGPTVSFIAGRLGEFGLGLSASKAEDSAGLAYYGRYLYVSRIVSFRLSHRNYDKFYMQAVYPDRIEPRLIMQQASVSLHVPRLGTMTASYARSKGLLAVQDEDVGISYGRRLMGRLSLLLRVNNRLSAGENYLTAFANLHLVLGNRASANAAWSTIGSRYNRNVYLQQNAPVGRGMGFRFRVGEDQDTEVNDNWIGDASAQMRARRGIVSGGYLKTSAGFSQHASWAGSVAFIDNRLFLSRPIRDSFALVNAADLDDVRVYFGNELIGKTHKGSILLPELSSYARNSIKVDARDIPVDMALKRSKLIVSPKYRTGGIASFQIEKFQGFTGHAFILRGDYKKTADYADFILWRTQNEKHETIVGRDGEFYLENLTRGKYSGILRMEGESCKFNLTVPDSREMLVDVGEIACRI